LIFSLIVYNKKRYPVFIVVVIISTLQNDGLLGSSWKLRLPHDDDLQPLYEGLPLPLCALEAGGILDYKNAAPQSMAKACRHAGAWKLASNGINVSEIANFLIPASKYPSTISTWIMDLP
jgi:hypothetical protein